MRDLLFNNSSAFGVSLLVAASTQKGGDSVSIRICCPSCGRTIEREVVCIAPGAYPRVYGRGGGELSVGDVCEYCRGYVREPVIEAWLLEERAKAGAERRERKEGKERGIQAG